MSDDPGLFDGPFDPLPPDTQVRRDDPETSHDAAERIFKPSQMMRNVLQILSEAPSGLTDLDVLMIYRRSYNVDARESSPRKRRCDLVRKGCVEWTGEKIHQEGRDRMVWAITAYGRVVLATETDLDDGPE